MYTIYIMICNGTTAQYEINFDSQPTIQYSVTISHHWSEGVGGGGGGGGGVVEWNSKKTGMRDENCIGMDIEEGWKLERDENWRGMVI